MRNLYFYCMIFLVVSTAMAQDKPAYVLFDKNGKGVTYSALLDSAINADIVFFGEIHNNPMSHWLQLQLTKDLFAKKGGKLVLGAEMFETDNQLVLDEYLAGLMKESNFNSEAKLWDNYKTDYAPLVNFAKENKIPFVATNVPRRYASLVAKQGLEALEPLSKEAKKLIAPLPLTVDVQLPGYANMLTMMGGHGGAQNNNMIYAQALKDATMANSILNSMPKDGVFLHYNGTYHSNNFEGICWYIAKKKPKLRVMTIASVEQTDLAKLDSANINLANFILAIPADMTKTY